MELTCPQCAKAIKMSLEELSTAKGVVVCPQCLREFRAEGIELLPQRPAPVPDEAAGALFCHDCGHRLPQEGLKFCPYCGVSLAVTSTAVQERHDGAVASAAGEKPAAKQEDRSPKFKFNMPLIKGLPRDYGAVMGSTSMRRFLQTLIVLLSLSFITLMVAIFLQQ